MGGTLTSLKTDKLLFKIDSKVTLHTKKEFASAKLPLCFNAAPSNSMLSHSPQLVVSCESNMIVINFSLPVRFYLFMLLSWCIHGYINAKIKNGQRLLPVHQGVVWFWGLYPCPCVKTPTSTPPPTLPSLPISSSIH